MTTGLIPLRDVAPGKHFYDPQLMIAGAVRYVGEHGRRIQVKIRRYRPGPEAGWEIKDASPGWMVMPGDMPPDVQAQADALLVERTKEAAKEMQKVALAMRKEGLPYDVIAEDLNITEHQARQLIQDAMNGHEPEEPVPAGPTEVEDRAARAYALRKGGMSYPKIAKQLGYKAPASARAAALRGAKIAGEELK